MLDIFGWIGAVLIVVAYFQAARNRWPSNGRKASVVNGCAGFLLGVTAFSHGAWPNVGLEVIFVMIAFFTFKKTFKKT